MNRRVLIWSGVALLLVAMVAAQQMSSRVREAYTASWVGSMVIRHLDETGGEWPSDWGDLRDDYDAIASDSGEPWTFEAITERVAVDWDADPARIAASEEPPKLVWLRSARATHWAGEAPNRMIFAHIRTARAKR